MKAKPLKHFLKTFFRHHFDPQFLLDQLLEVQPFLDAVHHFLVTHKLSIIIAN